MHVNSATGAVLSDVTVGSASLLAESLPAQASGSTSLLAELNAPSSPMASQNTSGSGFTADGSTYEYQITAYYTAGSTKYLSGNPNIATFTDNNSSDPFSSNVTWSPSANASGYKLERQINGGGFTEVADVGNVTSYEDSNSSSGGTYTAWSSFYQNIPATPPSDYTGGSAQATNVGAGGITEVSTTILLEVDSVLNISGVDYVSGTPTSGSFDDTGLGSYDAEMSWTDNGNSTNSIARISVDGGSTWYYQFTGSSTSPYTFTSLSNDSSAEARWGQTYTSGSITHAFRAYGSGLSPSGATVYSATYGTYTAVIPPDSVKYIVLHTITFSSSGYKITDDAMSYGYALSTSSPSTFGDPNYTTSFTSGATVTPTSFGFTGTNQNRDYKIYSSASGIFAVTPLTVSTVLGSGAKTVSLSWTLPTGITAVRILRSINGGAYNFYRDVTGSAVTDDSLDTTWLSGNTVTPTSIVSGTGRFDRASILLTEAPILQVINTLGSGERYSVLGFGTASSTDAAAFFQAHIYSTSATGYLSIATNRIELRASIGGTIMTEFGNSNVINKNQSSTNHFDVRGLNDSKLINTRSDMDTVGFGQAIGADPFSTVQIQPARSNDLALLFRGHSGHTANSNLVRWESSAGVFAGGITVGGYAGFARTLAPTNAIVALGAASGRTQLLFDNNASMTTVNGGVQYSSNQFYGADNSLNRRFVRMVGVAQGVSNRIPFFDTNGFLTDDSDLSFDSGNTLQATRHGSGLGTVSAPAYKLGSDTTGWYQPSVNNWAFTASSALVLILNSLGLTFADAKDIILNTTTGTKIGTSTSQKLGFWNATPIVQPTTAVASATFVANTSAIANDTATFDGYTIGKVVKALRNAGLLA